MSELVCITLDGVRYAIRGDRVLSREPVRSLHRLPFADPRGGVLAMVGEHAETLADLSVCLGHSPTPATGVVHALIMSNDPPIRGFIVGGELDAVAEPGDGLVPVPACLPGTPFEGFFAGSTSATNPPSTSATNPPSTSAMPLPVVDIDALYARVRAGGWTTPRNPLVLPRAAATPCDPSLPHRVIDSGGVLYALAGRRQWEPVRVEAVFRCPLLPTGIDGIILIDGTADPVVDLGRRMGGPDSAASLAVLTTVGDTRFAVLMDEDRGVWQPGSAACRTLPTLARPAGMAGVLQRSGESALLLDLGALLSETGETGGSVQAVLPRHDAPSSDFPARFGRDEVEVQEVMLLGMQHALPKSEVHAIVPRIPSRRIPRAPAVVTGVAEYEGDLLPVLDLSAGFGGERPSAAGQDMIVLQSGGFRALLLSEKVLAERRVRQDDQRPVPYAASHPFLYGCYVDGEAVRLIFNIAAIAMQFSLRSASDARAMLAQALGLAPESDAPGGSAPQAGIDRVEEVSRLPSEPAVPRAVIHDASPARAQADVPPAHEAPPVPETPFTLHEVPLTYETSVTIEPPAPQEQRAPQESPAPPASHEPLARQEPPAPREPARAVTSSVEAPPRVPVDATSEPESSTSTAETAEMHPTPTLPSEEPQLRIPEAPAQPEAHAPVEPAPAREGTRAERDGPPRGVRPAKPDRRLPGPRSGRSRTGRWLAVAAAALVVVAAAIVVLVPGLRAKVLGRPEANPTPAAAAPAAPAAAAPAPAPSPSTAETAGPTFYIVVEGDTLWTIAARLTGDPNKFGRLAVENGIVDPDRIYPGQKIRLLPK